MQGVILFCSCKRNKQNCHKYNFKIRRNEISYLGNEFRIKKWHLLEQPDATVKCSCGKFFGKKKLFFYKTTTGVKRERKNTDNLHRLICTIKKISLVDHALITLFGIRHLQFSHVNRFLKSSRLHYQFFSNSPFWMYVANCQRRM